MKTERNISRLEGNKGSAMLNSFQHLPRTAVAVNDSNMRGRLRSKYTMTLFHNHTGFTLIELLVVVLIIGILAAVALPQYQKAVEKSRAAQVLPLVRSLGQAARVYYIENGTDPSSLNDLDVSLSSFPGNTAWFQGAADTRSNESWSVQIYPPHHTIVIGRISGEYQGAGFAYFYETWGTLGSSMYAPADTLTCVERKDESGIYFKKQSLDYCEKLFGAKTLIQAGGNAAFYRM